MSSEALRGEAKKGLTPSEHGRRVARIQDAAKHLLLVDPAYRNARFEAFTLLDAFTRTSDVPPQHLQSDISFISTDGRRRVHVEDDAMNDTDDGDNFASRKLMVGVVERDFAEVGGGLKKHDLHLDVSGRQDHENASVPFDSKQIIGGHALYASSGRDGEDHLPNFDPINAQDYDRLESILTGLLGSDLPAFDEAQLPDISLSLQEQLLAGLALSKHPVEAQKGEPFGSHTPIEGRSNEQRLLIRIGTATYSFDSNLVDIFTPGQDEAVTHAIRRLTINISEIKSHALVGHHQIRINSAYQLRGGVVGAVKEGFISLENRGEEMTANDPATYAQVLELLSPFLPKKSDTHTPPAGSTEWVEQFGL